MPIDKVQCYKALEALRLPKEAYVNYKKMCDDGISIAQLFRQEIPKKGTCTLENANRYIQEEQQQMAKHLKVEKYNMDDISVAEHVYYEQNAEPEHAHALYTPVPGDVKFFEEWLEGHHPSLGCAFGFPNQNPPEEYYDQLAKAREEAYPHKDIPMAAMVAMGRK